jgi:SAM-dependent methyltransferase
MNSGRDSEGQNEYFVKWGIRVSTDSAVLEELNKLREEIDRLRAQQEASTTEEQDSFEPKELSGETLQERESFAEDLPIPGRDAPTFNLVSDFISFGVTPWADSLVPVYLLDKNYRIVDWNTPFSLAFDQTMEGRRGLSVLEWVCFLDNYEECLARAARDFADADNLPRLHIETIEYTSPRYGRITAQKRAYQIPKDDGDLLGWLVTLDVKHTDAETGLRYKRDLFQTLRRDLTWSEYALSYDVVLLASKTYPDLLNHVLGEQVPPGGNGTLTRIRRGARILDLGAGTGNVSRLLAEQQRGHVIFAVENNGAMLDLLRVKCDAFLRSSDDEPGVLAIKQDANVLFGLPEYSFDYAILSNVAYALEDPLPCLRQVCAALTPNGEIRVSGPQKSTDLETLFSQIGAELEAAGRTAELKEDFDRVRDINRNVLGPSLYRWDVDEMAEMLRTAGFKQITYSTDSAYAGQAMIIAARK